MSTQRRRLPVPDALRGVAALAVVLHHLLHNTVMEAPLRRILPAVIETVMTYGARGVQVFFVLSGFVITWSLQSTNMTRPAAASFALRRHIRLDGVYWLVIAASVVASALEAAAGLPGSGALPSPYVLVMNLLYLQNIVGAPALVGVAWTLCLEVQFYLLLLTILLLLRAVRRPEGPDVGRPALVPILWASGLCSLGVASVSDAQQWASEYWFYFAIGALVALAGQGRELLWAASLTTAMLAASALRADPESFANEVSAPVAGALAAAVLAVSRNGSRRLEQIASWRFLQYAGARSYSLYLVHLLVISVVLRLAYKVTGENEAAALAWLAVAALAVCGAAEALYRAVEVPSLRLGRRVRQEGPRALLYRPGTTRRATTGAPPA